jgi:GTP cyclohydrolase III
MTLEGHNLVQTHPDYHTLKATNDEVNNYNRWLHINDVARDSILTSLALELYVKLQKFPIASDMLEYLEVRFDFIPEQDTNTEMADVVSIQSEVSD